MPEDFTNEYYKPRVMIPAFEQTFPVNQWLLRTFFPSQPPEITEEIEIDVYREGARRMATFQDPDLPGQTLERDGYETKKFKPAYIHEVMPVKVSDLMYRQIGTNAYTPINRRQMLQRIVGRDLARLRRRRDRRLEWMAAQVLDSGKCPIKGRGVDREIDFGMRDSHKPDLTGTDIWTDSAADIEGQLVEWVDRCSDDSGVVPSYAILGRDAVRALLNNEKFLKNCLDVRRMDLGVIDPRTVSPALRWLGRLKRVSLDLYEYKELYYDPDTQTEKQLVPANKVWIASDQAYAGTYFGGIPDLDAVTPVETFVDSWVERNPKRRMISAQTAPIVALHQADAFLSAAVLPAA